LYITREVLLPFVAGMAVAYILDPILDRLEKAGLSRLLATILATTTFFVLIITLITFLIPLLQGQVVGFIKKLPIMIDVLVNWAMPFQQELLNNLSRDQLVEFGELYKSFGGQAVKWVLGLVKGIFDGGLAVFNLISLIFVTPIVCFYLLRDWDKMVDKINSWLPTDHSKQIREIFQEIDKTISCFVRGQLTVGLVLATIYSIGLISIGLDFGLLLGILSGLISFIPYFGMFLGLITASGIAFFQFGDPISILMVIAVFGFGQIIDTIFLTPKLVGGSVGLHSVWVIFSLMAGGALFGFIGILLAVPVAAIIGVLARFSIMQYLASDFYLGKSVRKHKNSSDGS